MMNGIRAASPGSCVLASPSMIAVLFAASSLLATAAAPAPAAAPHTLRIDYYHSGDATQQHFSLDRIVVEPGAWPGNPARPVDDTNLGKYLFEVLDRQ